MNLVRGLLDRLVLLAGVLAGGTLPSFVAQYRQRIAGQLDQVNNDLLPFQQIADRYHEGSLDLLIGHHLASSDPTFFEEGTAIRAMLNDRSWLSETLQNLNGDIFRQGWYLLQHADPATTQATWTLFDPSFAISATSILFAGCFALMLWLLFHAIWFGISGLLALTFRRRPAAR